MTDVVGGWSQPVALGAAVIVALTLLSGNRLLEHRRRQQAEMQGAPSSGDDGAYGPGRGDGAADRVIRPRAESAAWRHFAQSALADIFNPFVTTKSEGIVMGMGLSNARSIVEAHRHRSLHHSRCELSRTST